MVHGDASLIVWGRSECLRREAAFAAATAAGFAVLQFILLAAGVADDLVTPFGFFVPFALLVAGLLALMGTHQPRCRACDHGLEVNRFLAIAEDDLPAARAALAATDGRALAALALPEGAVGPRRHLRVRDCPRCGAVALVRIEREHVTEMGTPADEAVLSGDDARAVIAVAEIELG